MRSCSINKETQGDLDILHLGGSLDSFSFPKIEAAFATLRDAGRAKVILDCQDLEYISSVALGALIGFARRARENQGDLRLARLSPKIQGIIDLLGFNRILKSHATIEEAAKGLSTP